MDIITAAILAVTVCIVSFFACIVGVTVSNDNRKQVNDKHWKQVSIACIYEGGVMQDDSCVWSK